MEDNDSYNDLTGLRVPPIPINYTWHPNWCADNLSWTNTNVPLYVLTLEESVPPAPSRFELPPTGWCWHLNWVAGERAFVWVAVPKGVLKRLVDHCLGMRVIGEAAFPSFLWEILQAGMYPDLELKIELGCEPEGSDAGNKPRDDQGKIDRGPLSSYAPSPPSSSRYWALKLAALLEHHNEFSVRSNRESSTEFRFLPTNNVLGSPPQNLRHTTFERAVLSHIQQTFENASSVSQGHRDESLEETPRRNKRLLALTNTTSQAVVSSSRSSAPPPPHHTYDGSEWPSSPSFAYELPSAPCLSENAASASRAVSRFRSDRVARRARRRAEEQLLRESHEKPLDLTYRPIAIVIHRERDSRGRLSMVKPW